MLYIYITCSFDLYKRVKSFILSHKSDPTSHNESIRDKQPLFCQPLWKIQNNKESRSLWKIFSINSYKLQFLSSWEILPCSLYFISKSCYLWVQDAIWSIWGQRLKCRHKNCIRWLWVFFFLWTGSWISFVKAGSKSVKIISLVS